MMGLQSADLTRRPDQISSADLISESTNLAAATRQIQKHDTVTFFNLRAFK
jgi:hypothetical protein